MFSTKREIKYIHYMQYAMLYKIQYYNTPFNVLMIKKKYIIKGNQRRYERGHTRKFRLI